MCVWRYSAGWLMGLCGVFDVSLFYFMFICDSLICGRPVDDQRGLINQTCGRSPPDVSEIDDRREDMTETAIQQHTMYAPRHTLIPGNHADLIREQFYSVVSRRG